MTTFLGIALVLVAATAAVYVALWNDARVPLDLALVRFEQVQVGLLLLCAFLTGGALMGALLSLPLLRLRLRVRRQSRRVTRLEQEVHGLRTLPLTEPDEQETTASAEEG